MLFWAKNGTLSLDGCKMDYVRFGKGPRTLVLLPGLGDSLRTVAGPEAARLLAEAMPGAALKLYPEWGHGFYEEAPTFQQDILDFLLEQTSCEEKP